MRTCVSTPYYWFFVSETPGRGCVQLHWLRRKQNAAALTVAVSAASSTPGTWGFDLVLVPATNKPPRGEQQLGEPTEVSAIEV